MTKQNYNLRLKVLGGMIVFLLLVIAQALHQLEVLRQTEANHRLLGELNQIERSIELFPRRSQNYLDNAARDFESYFRDVRVFYKDLLADFDAFGARMDELRGEFMLEEGAGIGALLADTALEERANASIDQAGSQWREFHDGFLHALGDNKAEPLLEAGAEYVVSQHPALREKVVAMIGDYRAYLDDQAAASRQRLHASLGLTILLGMLGLIWFYRRVTRRIGQTVDACQIVAAGDFGYTLPVEGNDEISVLSKSFNTLSSRAQLVLDMMAQLQQINTVEQGLGVIVQASGSYLPVAWAGYCQVSAEGDQMGLTNAIPPKTLQGWNARGTSIEEPFGKQLADSLIAGRAVTLSDLTDYAVQAENETFIRSLVRATKIDALMALPVKNGRGFEAILLFGSRSAAYRPDQTELLEHMAPLLATSFERISREQSTQFGG